MWGSVLTEANTISNFNFGFSTYKSDILLHLSQWQYWWWFWFSLFWTVYFFLVIRVLNKRTFSFNPVLNTSIRGHGKWGDFLVALIPLSWCGNILVNSNFILRMIEWQNESSLFTIRVQGKQWYWVYKFDASAAQNIFAAPKNIGHNKWFVTSPSESYCADSYYQALHLGTQLEFKSLYYKYLDNDGLTKENLNNNSLQTNKEILTKFDLIKSNLNKISRNNSSDILKDTLKKKTWSIRRDKRFKRLFLKNLNTTKYFGVDYLRYDLNFLKLIRKALTNKANMKSLKTAKYYGIDYLKYDLDFLYLVKNTLTNTINNKSVCNISYYDYDQLDDLSNFAANIAQQQNYKPVNFLRGILNKHNYNILKHSNEVLEKAKFVSFKKSITYLRGKMRIDLTRLKRRGILTFAEKYKRGYALARKKLGYRPIKDELRDQKIRWNNPAYDKECQEIERKIHKRYLKDKLFAENFRKRINLSKVKHLYFTKFANIKDFLPYKRFKKCLLDKLILFNIQFLNNSTLVEKTEDSELFWGFRQKKYKRFKKFFFNQGFIYDSKTLMVKKQHKPTMRQLKNTLTDVPVVDYYAVFTENFHTPMQYIYGEGEMNNYYKSIKYNKHRNELVPVNLARRLLRVKRTLVLPAHVNITLISNSYDVVHSWFIPGLGLKIDCVPGRSTHHTFYIDNIGFYYGQCAEICGRYHHHMPIRLCALSFEHFLVWWQKKGLKRLHRFNSLKN